MELSKYKWPEVTDADLAFPNFKVPKNLLVEAQSRKTEKGREMFHQLFFKGGTIRLKRGVGGTWKEKALWWALAMMGSYEPKHEHKTDVCAMIFELCLKKVIPADLEALEK